MLGRREAIARFWGLVLASPLLAQRPESDPERTTPLDGLINCWEIEEAARSRLSPELFEHIAAGAESGRTVRANREFFERITFRPRMLVDVTELDLSSELLGQTMFAPILAGPTGLQGRFHPEGEAATVKGAALARALAVVSERSSRPLAEIGPAAGGPWWIQTSPDGDLERVREAQRLGAVAVVLTLDGGPRRPLDADVRRGSAKGWPPAGIAPTRPDGRAALERLRKEIGLPVVAKGLLTAEAARAAVEAGAAAVCVSNHGGRIVDGLPSTIEALPAVADAVGERVPVLADGGFRRGSDILKALAFGADAVLLGRPVLWALAAYGAEGVQRLLTLLQSELALAMGLSGTPNLAAVSRRLVKLHSR
ncbi:MAG: alpha-hydroxy-acid oxidizing protein [Acidobacteria bacterium]|nr:alpha-hydroxy-acid oxidizing protein [Acidobacteriota bacterium]